MDIDIAPAYFNLYLLQVERQGGRVGEKFDAAFNYFRSAMRAFKDAELEIFYKDTSHCTQALSVGLRHLESARAEALALVGVLETAVGLLQQPPNRDDFLIRREAVFKEVDYGKLYNRLDKEEAVLPNRLFWDAMAESFREDGCKGGLKLIRDQAGKIATTLEEFTRQMGAVEGKAGEDALRVLREDIPASAALHLKWAALMASCIYFTLIVQEGTRRLLEADRAQAKA
jgi:hypothetical protein